MEIVIWFESNKQYDHTLYQYDNISLEFTFEFTTIFFLRVNLGESFIESCMIDREHRQMRKQKRMKDFKIIFFFIRVHLFQTLLKVLSYTFCYRCKLKM